MNKPILYVISTALVTVAATANAQTTSWGVFDEIAKREWVTDKEPRPRVSKFRWEDEGRVLVARHGFVSRLQFGESNFVDTVQRFVRDPKTGLINVTYTYEDGRPPLQSIIGIMSDGSAIETFIDAAGAEMRNSYRSPTLSLSTIIRERKHGEAWTMLGTTRKSGQTREEIAENARRAAERRQLALAQAQAQEAARVAQLAAEDAEREAQELAYQADQQASESQVVQNSPNLLDFLNVVGASIQQGNQVRQQQFDRQLQQAVQEQAQRKAEAARAESQRLASENARLVQEANARQAAISAQYAQQRANSQTQADSARVAANANRERLVEAQRRQDEADRLQQDAEQRRAAEAERQRRGAQTQAAANEQRRQADAAAREQQRLLAERNAPVEWLESVTLCSKDDQQAKFGNWRCTGSLQMNYVNFEKPNWPAELNLTCGGPFNKRDLGMVNGYRAFGCGFGLPPSSNADIPRRFGVTYVPNRSTYRCMRSASSCP